MKIGSIMQEPLAVLGRELRDMRTARGALLRQRDDIQFALDAGTKVIDGLQHAIEMLEEEGNKI